MELFKVEYEGENIWVQKDENGSIFVSLPTRYGNRGAAFREHITHEHRGWRFTSTQDDDIEYYFHMWLKPDGRMAWANDMSHGIEEFNEPFNPYYPNAGVLNDTALKLYSIVKQIEAYQKRDMPSTELLLLRQYYLTTTLKMLGYDSIDAVAEDVNDSIGYLALNRVANQLQEYRDLSGLVISMGEISEKEVLILTAPENVDRKKALELAKPVKEQIEENTKFLLNLDSDLSRKRSILPDYRKGMSDKIGVYTWDNYETAVKNAALLLLELNADLLTPEQREKLGIPELELMDDLALRDKISELIDSQDFNAACKAEADFEQEQSEALVRKAKEMMKRTDIGDQQRVELSRIIEDETNNDGKGKKSLEDDDYTY